MRVLTPLRVVAALGLILTSVLVLALTAASSASDPTQGADVYGVGAGSTNLGPGGPKFITFAFSGHEGPNGDFGSFRFTVQDPNFPLDLHADVNCVNVFPNPPGKGGWIGGTVTKVTPYPNTYGISPGDDSLIGINDYGNPSGVIPDGFTPYYGSPGICKFLGPAFQTPISQGNITINLG
jgi:hypothetical protein